MAPWNQTSTPNSTGSGGTGTNALPGAAHTQICVAVAGTSPHYGHTQWQRLHTRSRPTDEAALAVVDQRHLVAVTVEVAKDRLWKEAIPAAALRGGDVERLRLATVESWSPGDLG